MTASPGTLVIAEAGVNHNGSLDAALKLVDVAAEAGADVVKFQTFRAARLVSASARKAAYQVENTGTDDGQLGMLRNLELSDEAHHRLASRCRERGIAFMSTAFDLDSLQFLTGFEMPATKIPSGDVTAAPIVLASAHIGRPIILSTGMCTLEDIEQALGVIAFGITNRDEPPSVEAFARVYTSREGKAALAEKVTLLHCVTDYPAALADVNLRALGVLRERFGLRVGYSDHTLGTAVSLAAVALGATVIEKHFTLDRNLPGPDHRASLEPKELADMVRGIRDIELALGAARKAPSEAEMRNRAVARRSIVARCAIASGEVFSEDNVEVKRPGTGLQPIHWWDLLGKPAARAYAPDEVIDP